MSRLSKFFLLVALFMCIAGAFAPTFAATERKGSTVGDLLVGIANLKKLPATDATTAGAALRTAGYDLPRLSPTKDLTEGDVAAVAAAVGLKVASSSPTRTFSASQMSQFLMAMRSDLQSRASSPTSPTQSSSESSDSGSGKKPRSKSPKNPDRESGRIRR